MDDDFELGNEFKDQLIPLALEYYLEVIEHDEEPDYGDEEGGDAQPDSDEDEKPKGGQKKIFAKK